MALVSYALNTSGAPGTPGDFGRKRFLEMIVHDDRTSFYHIARHDPKAPENSPGKWRECSRGAKHLMEFDFEEGYDWYITRNGFSSRKTRGNETCRQLNSFLFDIDAHGLADPSYTVDLVLATLQSAWESEAIPTPTMVVKTGRGVHTYFALDRSTSTTVSGGRPNSKGTKYFHDIENRLCRAIEASLELIPSVKVDRCVFDAARVSRVPGTLNTKAGERCSVFFDSGTFHTLASLSETLPKLPRRKPRSFKPFRKRDRFSQLASSRLSAIERLQEARGYKNDGNRELMCFCYYNSAVQKFVDRNDAFDALIEFNSKFANPIPHAELKGIRSSVDKVGFYRLTSAKISSFLNLTDEEAVKTNFFMSKRDLEREASKQKTAKTRKARNAKILFLKNLGTVTINDIAAQTNCSKSTVYAALSQSLGPEPIALQDALALVLANPPEEDHITTNNTDDNFSEPPISPAPPTPTATARPSP